MYYSSGDYKTGGDSFSVDVQGAGTFRRTVFSDGSWRKVFLDTPIIRKHFYGSMMWHCLTFIRARYLLSAAPEAWREDSDSDRREKNVECSGICASGCKCER